MDKQIEEYSTPRNVHFSKASDFDLKKSIDELQFLCHEVDPYKPLTQKLKKRLQKFYIDDFYDPFTITNKLLVLMEDALSEAEKRKERHSL